MANRYFQSVLDTRKGNRTFDVEALGAKNTWLTGVVSPPVAAIIETAIDDERNKKPAYEPLLFEGYVSEAARAIDRSIVIRRDIQEIESVAVTYARQYTRFDETVALNKKIEALGWEASEAKKLSTEHADVAKRFGAGTDPVAQGFAKQNNVASRSFDSSHTNLTSKNQAIADRWLVLEAMQEAERKQHETPGHALNFKERRDRLVEILKRDVLEAYRKCVAVREGIVRTYKPAQFPELPAAADVNALDRLLYWIRDAIEYLDKQREHEVEFDLTIPLVQPVQDWKNDKEVAVLKTADVQKLWFDVDVTAWLDNTFKRDAESRVGNLRLVGLGASVNVAVRDDNSNTVAFTLAVFPPKLERELADTTAQTRPPAILGNVAIVSKDSRAPKVEYGPEIRCLPVAGVWRIVLLPPRASQDGKNQKALTIADVFLHLRLVGTPARDRDRWLRQ